MGIRPSRVTLALLSALLVCCGMTSWVYAHSGAKGVTEERMDMMKGMADAMKSGMANVSEEAAEHQKFAVDAEATSEEIREKVVAGQTEIDDVLRDWERAITQLRSADTEIQAFENTALEIASIVEIIAEIAHRTNVLSLSGADSALFEIDGTELYLRASSDAAVETMLENGPQKRLFYLSIDFLRDDPVTPKQQLRQQTIEEAYPQVRELALRGSENPNLMPEQSITVRFHSVGGWGAITTGKNLAMTLFDLLGYHIKANPKYGSEKKGQPTTYYLSAAPEPIRVNCEYYYVDVVLSPDPNVFHHTNALAGLKEGGVFIIQSDRASGEQVWRDIPPAFQKIVIDKKIRMFAIDGFKIARLPAASAETRGPIASRNG